MTKDAILGWCCALTIAATAVLSACNTLEGAGKDVERAGEGIQDANCTAEDRQTDPDCQ